jgi:broad specificity phosphatase PhoE
MTRVLLLKHAQSTWNADGRWQGWHDAPLSEAGRREAREAARWLRDRDWSRTISSDLTRARQTADIISSELGIEPPAIEPRLREYDVGDWLGLRREEIEARWPGDLAAWRDGKLSQVPGGERWESFSRRVRSALEDILSSEIAPILVLTHGGVIEAATAIAGADQRRLAPLAGRWFYVSAGKLRAAETADLLAARS